jgi:hypothetical protein
MPARRLRAIALNGRRSVADIAFMVWVYIFIGIAPIVLAAWIFVEKDQPMWLLSLLLLGTLAIVPALLVGAKPGSSWRRRFGNEKLLPPEPVDQPISGGPTFTR